MYLKLAWRNIWRNKRRTIITLSSIGFAVFFACVMQSMQLGSYERLIDNVVRFYTGYIQVHKNGYWDDKMLDNAFHYDEQLAQKVGNPTTVEVVVPRLESFALASFGLKTKGALVLGIQPETEDALTNLKSKMQSGTYLTSDDDGALVGEGLADYLKIQVGDTLVLIGQGYHGINAAGKFAVKGIVKFPAPDLNNQLVYLSLPTSQWLYGAESMLTSLALVLPGADDVPETLEFIQADLDERYEVMGWREMMPELIQSIELDYVSGLVMLYILYGVVAFGIFGTFLMMTNERRYEFGIMMAVGMRRYKLQFMIVLEILMIAFVGTIIGAIASAPIVLYFHFNPITFGGEYAEIFEKFGYEPILPFSTDPAILYEQVTVVLIIVAFLAIYPLARITTMKIVEAIRD